MKAPFSEPPECLFDPLVEVAPKCRAWSPRERRRFARHQLRFMGADLGAILRQDPALRGRVGGAIEALFYPGWWALVAHRVAHLFFAFGLPVLPRLINFSARFFTGVDIHPGARIGPGLFIDHGDGVVIGETAEIGRDVVLFHQVTLGGRGGGEGKRHPTLGDGVLVGAGAKILGAIEVESGARVGANAVVLAGVPPKTTVVGIPAQIVRSAPRIVGEVHQVFANSASRVGAAVGRICC